MSAVRRLLALRHLAVLICAAALFVKLLVPTGYMVEADRGRVALAICSGVVQAPPAVAGMHGAMPGHDAPKEHGKAEIPCAFSALSAASLGAVDSAVLATLVAFVMAVGIAGVMAALPASPGHLRPPLRGPPATL